MKYAYHMLWFRIVNPYDVVCSSLVRFRGQLFLSFEVTRFEAMKTLPTWLLTCNMKHPTIHVSLPMSRDRMLARHCRYTMEKHVNWTNLHVGSKCGGTKWQHFEMNSRAPWNKRDLTFNVQQWTCREREEKKKNVVDRRRAKISGACSKNSRCSKSELKGCVYMSSNLYTHATMPNTMKATKKDTIFSWLYIQIFWLCALALAMYWCKTHTLFEERLTFRSDYENGRQLMVSYLCKVLTIHKICLQFKRFFFLLLSCSQSYSLSISPHTLALSSPSISLTFIAFSNLCVAVSALALALLSFACFSLSCSLCACLF